jgi:peptidyl-prolyl cis-trans isomerase A (cyclophilin A)
LQKDASCGDFRGVKSALLSFTLVCPLHAALLGHVQTSLGTIDVELQYDKAPQAVANFITLAKRTRAHLDPVTGALSYKPYYAGEKFFRIVNGPGFRIAQTGSGTGTNGGGPGFTFKDEFTPLLRHVPYVLSMANSGPNTNGSQIFFTGNETINSLNDVHTIFGLVPDPASRAVIDAVLAAGNDGSSVTGITFERTDPAAVAFDEFAQNLPTVICPKGKLSVTRNVTATWTLEETLTVGDIFRAFRSPSLAVGSWSELGNASVQVGFGAVGSIPQLPPLTLDQATDPKEFFNLSYVRHPGSVAPVSLNSRSLIIDLHGDTLRYDFDITGAAATGLYTPLTGAPIAFTATVYDFAPSGHSFNLIVDNTGLNPRNFLFKCGWDSASASLITGRHSSSYYNLGWQPLDSGTTTITR